MAEPQIDPPPDMSTPLIGRDNEIGALVRLLRQPYARWITLTGPGGTGKTSLALATADLVRDEYEHGIFFVGLESVRDISLVLATVARTLGIQESPGPLSRAIRQALQEKQILLIVDNMEQVALAAAQVAELLNDLPRLVILATSRERLQVYGEREFPVPPLPVPANASEATFDTLDQNPAVQLFLERARRANPALNVTRESFAAIALLCRRLDGLPLAIELVAAQARHMSPVQMLAAAETHWHLSVQSDTSYPVRQSSMYAAMDWSYKLLRPAQQAHLTRLAAFAGTFSLDAAHAVADADPDSLSILVDANLIQVKTTEPEPRFQFLETIREFAFAQLQATDNWEAWLDAHSAYFVQIAGRAETELTGTAQAECLRQLDWEHDNLRAAIEWSLRTHNIENMFALVTGLWRFWYIRGHFTEGRGWLERVLGYKSQATPTARAKALHSAGILARSLGDYEQAREWLEVGRVEFERLGDARGSAGVLNSLGLLALDQINYGQAQEFFTASLALDRTLGDQRRIAVSLNNLGNVAGYQRDYARARVYFAESLALRRSLNDEAGTANALLNLGEVALRMDEFPQSLELYQASLALRRELGDRRGIALCLEGIAAVCAGLHDETSAVQFYSAAAELRRALNAPHAPIERAEYETHLQALRDIMGDARFAGHWQAARVLPLDQATEMALQWTQEHKDSSEDLRQ